jgi:diamine N-acetyltransferase
MVKLEPTTTSDLEFVLACEADPDTRPFILPWSQAQHLATLTDADYVHCLIRDWQTQQCLGFVIMFGVTSPHQVIHLKRIVCAVKGQGIGRAAIKAVKQLAFETYHAHRLGLEVKSRNTRARQLYISEGFIEEGLLRECLWEEGRYESMVPMSILRDEYQTRMS